MPQHTMCRHSTQPYLHSASLACLTSHFASLFAPANRSSSTTAAFPCIAASFSGVCPFCGARQRSGHSSLQCVAEVQTHNIDLLRKPTETRKQRCPNTPRVAPRPSPICIHSLTPRPPHPSRRILDRACRQKLLHHRRMPLPRSAMQWRFSILRRAAGLSQARPLSARLRRETKRPRQDFLNWQTFAVMARVWEDILLFLSVTNIKKKMCELLAPPSTPATLFTTPALGATREPKEIKPLSYKALIARRVALLTLVQCPAPKIKR